MKAPRAHSVVFICTWLLAAMTPAATLALDGSSVLLGQLQLKSNTSPNKLAALDAVALELCGRTSVTAPVGSRAVPVPGETLYDFPLLFLPATQPLDKLDLEEQTALSGWLRAGGTLVIDWEGGGANMEPFRSSVEQFAAALLPGATLERVPRSDVLYRSFYKVAYASGRLRLVDDLYGVPLDGRYAVLVTYNDLLSAAERDPAGEYRFDAVPGGSQQREDAVRLLVNLVLHALCLDYKDEKVHLDYLKSRRNWQLPAEEP
jgi:hypothetical protein